MQNQFSWPNLRRKTLREGGEERTRFAKAKACLKEKSKTVSSEGSEDAIEDTIVEYKLVCIFTNSF